MSSLMARPLPHRDALAVVTPSSRLYVSARVVWAFGVAILVTYLSLLAPYRLGEPDEARYAEIPREMIERGDWVTPHLNYVKYFEKPPLVYWLTAINFELFGMRDGVARLWPALFGLLGIGMAGMLGRSMYGPWTGYAAAALLAATPFYFGLSQVLVLDMPLTALMTLALGGFWFAYTEAGWRRAGLVLLYGATALAVLTKGPVAAVLATGIIGLFLLVQRDLAALRWVLSPAGLLLFFAIALPWFVLVSYRNPEFVDFFIVKQHLARFLTPNEHREPLWFFVPIVFGGVLPWTLFVLLAPRTVKTFATRLLRRHVSAGTVYCLAWSAVVFGFFSLSGSKLATYVLPMFCPLAILLARFFERVIENRQAAVLRRGAVAILVIAVGTLLGAVVSGEIVDDPNMQIILPRMYGGAALLGATGIVALLALRRQALQAAFAVFAIGLLALQLMAISGRGVIREFAPLGLAIRKQAQPDDRIVTYRHYVQGIPFYGRRRTVLVGGRGELDFGSRQGDQRRYFWDTDAALLAAWAEPHRRMFLVINRVELEPLAARLRPAPREIAGYGKKVVVVNFE